MDIKQNHLVHVDTIQSGRKKLLRKRRYEFDPRRSMGHTGYLSNLRASSQYDKVSCEITDILLLKGFIEDEVSHFVLREILNSPIKF